MLKAAILTKLYFRFAIIFHVKCTGAVRLFMACTVAAVLLRTQDKLRFSLVWNDTLTMSSFGNKRFPTKNEKM